MRKSEMMPSIHTVIDHQILTGALVNRRFFPESGPAPFKSMVDPSATDHAHDLNPISVSQPTSLLPTPSFLGDKSTSTKYAHYENLVKGFTTVTVAVRFPQQLYTVYQQYI